LGLHRYNKIKISVILNFQAFSIAFSLIAEGECALVEFMEENGYVPIESTDQTQPNPWAEEDMIFIKKKPTIYT